MSTSIATSQKAGDFGVAPLSQSGHLDDKERALFNELKAQFLQAVDLAPDQRVWWSDGTML